MNIKYFTILNKITTFAMSKDKNNIIKQFKTLWCIGELLQEIWLNIMQLRSKMDFSQLPIQMIGRNVKSMPRK